MKKHIMAVITAALMLTGLTGCGNFSSNHNSGDNNSSVNDDIGFDVYKNSVVPIFNAKNEEIGSIDCYYYSVFVNNSILYTKLPENASSDDRLEYWLYDIETKDNYKLAVVDNCNYEASYEAIKTDNHLYLSIFSGEFAAQNSKQTIYDIDLSEHNMLPMLEIEGGIPYNSYTIANNKLIIAELLYNGYTDLVEYDLNQKRTSAVVHTYNESDCFVNDSIRHICTDNENIYMVRLHRDESENYFLYLDKYDFDYNLLNTVDISDFCVSTDRERTEDGKINEWKQFILYFFVHNDLLYYQNFSTTNAIGIMENEKANRLFNVDALFAYVHSFSDSVNDLFIQSCGDDTDNRNIFYLVDSQTHEVKTAQFFADNHDYTFNIASRDGNKILLTMGYVPFDKGERLPDRLYYIDINDLDFKTMDFEMPDRKKL